MKTTKLKCAAILLAVVIVAGGCREGVPPFTPTERDVTGNVWQLTFSYGQDTNPQWLPAGDTLLYHTTRFPTMPQLPGAIARISATGGPAAPLFPAMQTVPRRLTTPVHSPTGDRIAYMHLIQLTVPQPCSRPGLDGPTCADAQPVLDSAVLRVRSLNATGDISTDQSIGFRFPGTDPGRIMGTSGPWTERLFPYQAGFRQDTAMLFRPSWSPDGQSIVFSNGMSLHRWNVGEPTATQIPNTADGVSAAWSPDGQWIAFTLLQRADSQSFVCNCGTPAAPLFSTRTIYTIGDRSIVLIRPDGTDRTVITHGEDPAWSPDGQHLYVVRDNQIVRITRAGADPLPIPQTADGRSPAISSDGRLLAFARRKPQLIIDYDIWIARLQP